MTSSFWLMLAGIAAVNLMGAASPGPAFFVVSRTAVGQSRRAGLATAYGVVLATMIWAFATIHGLALLFERAPWLLQLLQVLGGAYLLYLAFQGLPPCGRFPARPGPREGRQSRQGLPPRLHHQSGQSQDRRLLRRRLHDGLWAGHAGMDQSRRAAGDLRRRDRLVLPRRLRLLLLARPRPPMAGPSAGSTAASARCWGSSASGCWRTSGRCSPETRRAAAQAAGSSAWMS